MPFLFRPQNRSLVRINLAAQRLFYQILGIAATIQQLMQDFITFAVKEAMPGSAKPFIEPALHVLPFVREHFEHGPVNEEPAAILR